MSHCVRWRPFTRHLSLSEPRRRSAEPLRRAGVPAVYSPFLLPVLTSYQGSQVPPHKLRVSTASTSTAGTQKGQPRDPRDRPRFPLHLDPIRRIIQPYTRRAYPNWEVPGSTSLITPAKIIHPRNLLAAGPLPDWVLAGGNEDRTLRAVFFPPPLVSMLLLHAPQSWTPSARSRHSVGPLLPFSIRVGGGGSDGETRYLVEFRTTFRARVSPASVSTKGNASRCC